MGYSLNTFSLLAIVLSVGLVVDDAIVDVENVQRHIARGLDPMTAAFVGSREIGFAVVATTLTLASVYLPIGFLPGMMGELFQEFAFTLAEIGRVSCRDRVWQDLVISVGPGTLQTKEQN